MQTAEQSATYGYLNKYINSSGYTQITVVSGSDTVAIDSWFTETLDIQDIEALGPAPGVSSIGTLIHAFEEEYQKQVTGIEDLDVAHDNYAVPAEEAVAGATRHDEPIDSLTVAVTYEYPGGFLFHTRITANPFGIIKHGDDPIRRVCR